MRRFECSALIFDLDGVLVDSARVVEQQWRRWAVARGLRAEPFLRVCHGRRALETIRIAAPQLNAEAEVAAFEPPEEADVAAVAQVAGAARLLGTLPADAWGVATSGIRRDAAARLRRAGLPEPAVLVCAEDVLRGKPSPDAYLLAAARLGADPATCLVVEDAPAGVQAARAAAMPVIGLTTTHAADQLAADAVAATLAGVYLGRVDRSPNGGRLLEIFVIEP
ncbi:MAG TPA: HAD-IA family hydrolase [Gemmatimonadales bacterium]|nr:HAD-IA family hydrolase [Gemmatimonadales bacterium]